MITGWTLYWLVGGILQPLSNVPIFDDYATCEQVAEQHNQVLESQGYNAKYVCWPKAR